MTLPPSVDTDTRRVATPDAAPSDFGRNFPTPQLVNAAAALLTPDKSLRSDALMWEQIPGLLYFTHNSWISETQRVRDKRAYLAGGTGRTGHGIREGAQWRIVVSPGALEVRSTSPARAERAAERAADAHSRPRRRLFQHGPTCLVGSCLHESCREIDTERLVFPEPARRGRITAWSAKSRSKMCLSIRQLDYTPFFESGETPAMVTLTYPGDWLAVAPGPSVCRRHVERFKERFRKAWGRPIRGLWKREFQRRGAPHYHLYLTIPRGTVKGLTFTEWLSVTWAEVVGSESCGAAEPVWGVTEAGEPGIICCERHRHVRAGTGVDYDSALQASDPHRLAVYFAKHGAFAAKEYQNEAPDEWDTAEGIGRFWGVWGLAPARATVEVTPTEADAARRTLRRYGRSHRYQVRVPVWRKVTTIDRETGEIGWRWRKRHTRVWVKRLGGPAGYLAVNDGPAIAGHIGRHLDAVTRRTKPGGMSSGLRAVDVAYEASRRLP